MWIPNYALCHLQAHWRGRAVRQQATVLRAVVRLQAAVRGGITRRALTARREAAVILQAAWRRRVQRLQFLCLRSTVIQVDF